MFRPKRKRRYKPECIEMCAGLLQSRCIVYNIEKGTL